MRLRNNIFAEAFKWLKKNKKGIKYQKDLAAAIGVSEDTITRIMRDQTDVTDDFLCKFNEAFDNVFNYQWLRGEDPIHMLTQDVIKDRENKQKMEMPASYDFSIMIEKSVEKATHFADKIIATLEKQVEDKDKLLADKDEELKRLRHELNERESTIRTQQSILRTLQEQVECYQRTQAIISDPTKYPFPVGSAEPGNETDRVNL